MVGHMCRHAVRRIASETLNADFAIGETVNQFVYEHGLTPVPRQCRYRSKGKENESRR
jgi:ribosomal protein L31E